MGFLVPKEKSGVEKNLKIVRRIYDWRICPIRFWGKDSVKAERDDWENSITRHCLYCMPLFLHLVSVHLGRDATDFILCLLEHFLISQNHIKDWRLWQWLPKKRKTNLSPCSSIKQSGSQQEMCRSVDSREECRCVFLCSPGQMFQVIHVLVLVVEDISTRHVAACRLTGNGSISAVCWEMKL